MSTLKLSCNSSNKSYAHALRVIGRHIANCFPENLIIEVIGAAYNAHFQARNNLAPANKGAKTTVLQKLFSKSSKHPVETKPSHSMLVPEVRTYTQKDIDGIYASQIASRKSPGGNPDIYELGERLRTVGRAVELRQGRLMSISKGDRSITFQYCDPSGRVHTEEITNQNLYRLQREYFSERENKADDVWNRDAR